MIIRRRIEHGFTVIPRAAFEDTRLSFEARGVLGYILVKPDDWRVHVTDLARNAGGTGCGRGRIYRILDELKAAGYMTYRQTRAAGARMSEGEYVVTDQPAAVVSENPDTEKPDTDEPDTENTGAYQVLTATKNEPLPRTNGIHPQRQTAAAGAALDAGLSPLDHGQAVRAASDQPGMPAKNGRNGKPGRAARVGAAPLGPGAVVYRDVVHLTPNHVQRVTLDDALAAHGEARMRAVLADWLGRGYSPKNVTGMVDAMAHGLNGYARNGNGRAAPDFSQVIL